MSGLELARGVITAPVNIGQPLKQLGNLVLRPFKWAGAALTWSWQVTVSAFILALLFFIIINFYVFSSIVNLDSFFFIFLLLSVLTDGLFIFAHLIRKPVEQKEVSFDPSKLTVVIACYNGADIIKETIKQAMVHVPRHQILVVSDASTDNTMQAADSMGVRVIENKRNLNKAFSISKAMQFVKTPYVLILDDDTLIGKTFIPTSLLDEGYTAVAFNVMPAKHDSLVNKLQRMEYRMSMQLGKNFRGSAAVIGNVSGAIGLYHTKDLVRQIRRHSGQFAGEDEQRTLLAHLEGSGKGVTYTDSMVITEPPATFKALYRQRAYTWNLNVAEQFVLYWKLLLSPRFHYLLKAEKAYNLYIYLTDPLRILFFWSLFLRPSHIFITYGFYLALTLAIWARTGFKDNLGTVLLYPFYTLALAIPRFVGHFYWLKVKAVYLAKRYHKLVTKRNLAAEYATVITVMAASWAVSVNHFANDLALFNKINSYRLEEESKPFSYDNELANGQVVPAQPTSNDTSYVIPQEKGDTPRAIAFKAINQHFTENPRPGLTEEQKRGMYEWLAVNMPPLPEYIVGNAVTVDKGLVIQAVTEGAVQ